MRVCFARIKNKLTINIYATSNRFFLFFTYLNGLGYLVLWVLGFGVLGFGVLGFRGLRFRVFTLSPNPESGKYPVLSAMGKAT
jgi:hypothetical protein